MQRSIIILALSVAAPMALTGCMETMPRPERPRPPERPLACTREFAPVCAMQRGQQRTFENACVARSQRWRIVHNGPCAERPRRDPR